MKTFILFWNPEISSYTIERLREDLEVEQHVSNWSVWEHKKAHKGDRFFMVRCGEGKTGICMSGFFSSEPYQDEDWSGKGRVVYYMDLSADFVIDPDILPILSTEILSQKIPSFDWSGGHSGRLLPAQKAKKLEKLWEEFLEENDWIFGKMALKTYVTYESIMGFDDDYEPYRASIEITEDGEFEIRSVVDDVEVVGEDLETVKREFAKKMKEAGKTIPIEFNVWKVENQELFQKALDIANEAYCGMKDEYGQPYIKRALKETEGSYSDVEILVCLLHYVLKNPEFTTDTLIQRGIPKVVVDAVEVLHQKESENFEQYLQRVGENQQVSRLLHDIVEQRLDIKKLPELSLDRFTGLAQDLKAFHYLDEMQRKRRQAVFHGPAKDFDMWFDLYGYANPIVICGEYNDDEVAEMARVLKYKIGWKLDISELNVGRWTKDEPHEATYEEEILMKLGEGDEVNFIEKMILNRKYGTLFISDYFNDAFVTTSDGRVLIHCRKVEDTIIVPDTVEIIGRCAFAGIEKPEFSVVLPDKIVSIEDHAFDGSDGLVKINFPDSLQTLGEFAFCGCTNLTEVLLPNQIEEIPTGCFQWMPIEKLHLPDNLKYLRNAAFVGFYCKEVVLPSGVEVVESESLAGAFDEFHVIHVPKTIKEFAEDFYYEEGIDPNPEEYKPSIIMY
ncbi:MAG: leucine-rich repeat domain-containing protein [Bacteroidales bacterium]|nr:leucine-rich repeat domain-containing protein [Bacteroidales bacterium]